MIISCDSYIPLSVPLGIRPLCFRTTVAGRDVLSTQTATMKNSLKELPEYTTWLAMKQRCQDPNSTSYSRYGGRGIKVCRRWAFSFQDFLEDMGSKPTPCHSIERKNNDGDYEPDNCVWATAKEQANNRRSNTILSVNGKAQTLAQWADETGFGTNAICNRLEDGWTVDRALTEPIYEGNVLTHSGKSQCVRQWAKQIGVNEAAIRWRLKHGWSVDRALSTPKNPRYNSLPHV